MPLTPTTQVIPADIKKALLAGLDSFESFKSTDETLQHHLENATEGLQVFTIGVPEVLPGGKGLDGATPSGWRIAVRNGDGALAADIYTMARRGKNPLGAGTPRIACIREGQEIEDLLQTIDDLSNSPLSGQLPSVAFDIHLLIMPGLFTDALLLEPQKPGSASKYVVPFHTLVDDIQLNHAYTEQELIALLRSIAKTWMAYKPRPRPTKRATSAP